MLMKSIVFSCKTGYFKKFKCEISQNGIESWWFKAVLVSLVLNIVINKSFTIDTFKLNKTKNRVDKAKRMKKTFVYD
jgi:hypothetical protein